MRIIVGSVKAMLLCVSIFWGTGILLLTSFLPFKWRGISLAGWVATGMARLFLRICGVKVEYRGREDYLQHHGFVFPNHDSYLDILIPMSVMPMRFLAASFVREMWFIGRITRALGTVFVDRDDKSSRQSAREQLAALDTYPPIVLFPEGGIDGDVGLQPFRYGAFEIAIANQTPILPSAIIYSDFQVACWYEEPIIQAVWRLLTSPPIHARLITLPVIEPKPDDDAKQLADSAHKAVAHILATFGGQRYKVNRTEGEKVRD